jgi:hypothetical protein
MLASLPELLPTCFVKLGLTLQSPCNQTNCCLSTDVLISNCLLTILKFHSFEYVIPLITLSLNYKMSLNQKTLSLFQTIVNLEDCEPKSFHQGEGQTYMRGKNWADSLLHVFCLSDYSLWQHPSAKVKLFFFPCWVTPWSPFGNGTSNKFDELNVPTKSNRLAQWLSKRPNYLLPKQNSMH